MFVEPEPCAFSHLGIKSFTELSKEPFVEK